MLYFLLQGDQALSLVTVYAHFPPSRESYSLFSYRVRSFSFFKGIKHSLLLPGTLHFPPSRESYSLFSYRALSISSFRESYSLFGYRACSISSFKGIILSLWLPGTLFCYRVRSYNAFEKSKKKCPNNWSIHFFRFEGIVVQFYYTFEIIYTIESKISI